jgi:SLT domain-containing protein/murein DD-endopeptidase MepM/ murein hydrolase activator NlpD
MASSSYRDLILKFAADTSELKKATAQMKDNLDETSKDAAKSGDEAGKGYGKSVSSSLKSVAGKVLGALGAMFAFDKIKDFAKEAYAEARESQKVGAQTAAVIKSTGGAAKITAKQVGDLATSISNKTGIDDENIQTGENMLLTFKNLRNEAGKGNDIFNQSTQIMTDMSVATGKDMTGSAVMLGKALNDPTKGISALSRVGVTFTEQQKKQIKAMQASGDTMGAQKIILKELKSEFGGSAAAQATAGEKLTTVWKNFQEEIGTAFLPVVDKVMNILSQKLLPQLSKLFEFMVKHQKTVLIIAGAIGAIALAMKAASVATEAFSTATKLAAAAQWLFNAAMDANPIGLIILALAALAVGLVVAYKKSETFRKFVNAMWAGVTTAAKAFIAFFSKTVPAAFQKTWNAVTSGTKAFLGFFTKTIPATFMGFVKWISGTFSKAWGAVKYTFTHPLDAVRTTFTTLLGSRIPAPFIKFVTWIKGTFAKAWGAVKYTFTHPLDAVRNTISTLFGSRITGYFNKLVTFATRTFGKAWAAVKYTFTHPIDAARIAINTYIGIIRNAFSKLTTWTRNVWHKGWSAVSGWISGAVQKGRDAGKSALTGLTDKFTSVKNWVKDKWLKAWGSVKGWIADSVGKGRDAGKSALTGLTDKFTAVRVWLRDKWTKAWASAKGWITRPIEQARAAISSLLTGKKGISQIFRSAVDAFGRVWGGLKAAIGKPLNAVISFINLGLIRGGINKILGALGVPKKNQIPWIAPVKYATGGPIRGRGTGTSDSNLIRASRDEHMWSAEEVRKFGGHRKMAAWRKAIRTGQAYDYPGYAAGGVVRPVPGPFGRFPSYPGHTGVDFPVGMNTPVHAVMAGVIKSVRSLTYSYGRHIIQSLPIPGNYEGLYAHLNSFAVKTGQHVGAGQVIAHSDDTGNSTGPHLHFTLQHPGGNYVDPTSFLNGGVAPSGGGAGGVVSSVIGFLKGLDPVKWLINKATDLKATILNKIGTNPLAQGLSRIPLVLIQKAASYMKDKLFGSVGSQANPPGSGVERWRATISTALGMNHLPTTDDYVNAWLRQVQSESGGNPNAVQHGYTDVNTISGDLAKGLLQTITATFNANKFPGHGNIFNGLDNALAAIRYAKGRYGAQGMLAVIGHGHGYDNGGWLPPGVSLAMNHTGKPEAVLTPGQFSALAGGSTIEVHFHGVIDSASAAREIDNLLRNRSRLTSGITQPSRTRPILRAAT